MIRMPMTEQVLFTVARHHTAARPAVAGSGARSASGEAEAGDGGVVYAFAELLDAKTGAPRVQPLTEGRLLLAGAETLPSPPGTQPCRIPDWGVSPKQEDLKTGPRKAQPISKTAALPAETFFWEDFVTPPEPAPKRGGKVVGTPAPAPPPVGCLKFHPRLAPVGAAAGGSGEPEATYAVTVANCPVPGVNRYRLTLVTNLRLVTPPGSGSPLVVSPPEVLHDDAYFALQEPGAWHSHVHHAAFPASSLGHGGILLTKQEQYVVQPTADCLVYALLRAGVKEGQATPATGAGGAHGAVVLAVTPNDSGKACRSWERSPLSAKGAAESGESGWFRNDITEDGDVACVCWYAKGGVSYSVMPVPNDWKGAPGYRLGIYSTAPLKPLGSGPPGSAAAAMQIMAP
jgi:hypothetical protein